MRSIFGLAVIALVLTGCASRPKQEEQTRAVWTRVLTAIQKRDAETAKLELRSLGTHATVKSPNGDYWHLQVSELEQGVDNTITNLKRCDSGLKRKALDDVRKCTPPESPEETNFVTVWLKPFYSRFPETLRTDFSAIESPFKIAAAKLEQDQESEKQSMLKKQQADAALAEENERKAIEKMRLAEEQKERDPKTWAERACSSHGLIARSKDLIKQEKEGAKHSGVVNQATLHGAGQTIAFMEKQLSKQKAEYRKYSGKDWSPSLCK